jgi:hypothetical protein
MVKDRLHITGETIGPSHRTLCVTLAGPGANLSPTLYLRAKPGPVQGVPARDKNQ